MTKAERMRRTERKQRQRAKQWAYMCPDAPTMWFTIGKARKQSPFDCGKPGCSLCRMNKEEHRKLIKRQAARTGS